MKDGKTPTHMEEDMYFHDNNFIEELRNELPIIFTRETACKLLGGIFTPRTLSNFDAAGKGPRGKQHIGRKVAYSRDEFVDWLRGRLGDPGRDVGRTKVNPYW